MTPFVESTDLLIVEDNPTDLELTLRSLSKCASSPTIDVVKDGSEALDYIFATGAYKKRAAAVPPKVIFLDLKLPKVDGLEILRQLKTHDRTKNIPVVMLTSSQQECDIRECYRLGVNSYIVKPVDFQKFTEAIVQMGQYWIDLNYPPR
jgi:CheY-like chemotaxis protein